MHFKASVKKLLHSFKSSGKVLHKRGPVVTKAPLIEVVAHTIPLTIKLRLEGYMLTLIHILILTYNLYSELYTTQQATQQCTFWTLDAA